MPKKTNADSPGGAVLEKLSRDSANVPSTTSAHPDSARRIPPLIAARNAAREVALAAACAELFPEPASLVLELGCGHGHFLTAYATAHPATPCLGVDRISLRITRAQRKQSRARLPNLAFLKADALETVAALPPHIKLAGIFVLFPDPWPKHRHRHHRLLQPALLDALAARTAPGAWLALRTDHDEFFAWARTNLAAHPAWALAPVSPWPFEHPTVFQERLGAHQSLIALRNFSAKK
jgi:tRNA (guanine-N7-)-methyltransferase